MSKWKIREDKGHWIELIDAVADADDDTYDKAQKEGGTAACIKWDGCVHFVLGGDYLHICNVKDLIERLEEIQALAKERGFEGYDG